ncbi:titin-like [Belonocnema kinseyi]|uniref:titin-like n=1 Tax=Belonocnema kinseyi TaxID=2817044 RepID=UPI00143D7911|nr:titin-like [Belonocnema kinseyi]
MQSCSIRGCQSYKTIQTKPVAYFKFPFHNEKLLESWLSQINQDNFSPASQDQICSTHFLIEDIEPSSIGRYPILKPDATPTVFPERKKDPGPAVKAMKDTQPKIIKSEIKPAVKETKAKIIKSEIKPAVKKSPSATKFDAILVPEPSKSPEITIVSPPAKIQTKPSIIQRKPAIIQRKPAVIPQKVVQLPNKPAIQTTQIITSPIQIPTRGIPIQPKPIQIQKIQFHPNIQLQGKPQFIQFQGKHYQIQQQSPIQIQQQSPVQIQQKSPIQIQTPIKIHQTSPIIQQKSPIIQQKSPISIQQQSPILIPQNPMIQFQQSIQPNGKLIPLKQINVAELQEILAKSNNVQKDAKDGDAKKLPSVLKPNILAKKIVNANTSLTGSSPDNKRPILRIQINKLNDEGSKKLGSTSKENATKVIRTKPEEVQIKALNKSVIFRLEPSGKIVVETVETKDGVEKVVQKVEPKVISGPVPRPAEIKQKPVEVEQKPEEVKQKPAEVKQKPVEVKQKPVEVKQKPVEVKQKPKEVKQKPKEVEPMPIEVEPMPIEVEPMPIEVEPMPVEVEPAPVEVEPTPIEVKQKPEEVKQPDPKLSNLKTLYNKAQEDCEKLSKKLASLKQRHQEEQEQILKLQGHLSGLDKKVEKSYDSDISGSSVTKKRKIVTQKEEEDEYEKLLREVRKIKADYDKNIFSKPMKKQVKSTQAERLSLERDARELEDILTQDQTINTTVIKRERSKVRSDGWRSFPVVSKTSPQKKKIVVPEIQMSTVVKRQKLQVPEKQAIVQNFDMSPSKNDGEIIGLIDEENEDVNFSDEMNFEAEYLDPEFIDC